MNTPLLSLNQNLLSCIFQSKLLYLCCIHFLSAESVKDISIRARYENYKYENAK